MRNRIVVVGASAGGVEALQALVSGLPADFPAPVFVVLHMRPNFSSRLPKLLERAGRLPARAAEDGEPIEPGHVYVSRPDRHLLIDGDNVRVTRGPRENRSRPAIDVLFRSAAYTAGPRSVGVVLSGVLDDGTAGLWAIKDRGGIAIVQTDAIHSDMPDNAAQHVAVDFALPVDAIPAKLVELVARPAAPVTESEAMRNRFQAEVRIAAGADALEEGFTALGPLSPNTCPECHGALVEIAEGSIRRFRCHTGHAYSLRSLLASLEHKIDEGISSTMRALEERILLLGQLAHQAEHAALEQRCREQQARSRRVVDAIREFLLSKEGEIHYLTLDEHDADSPQADSTGGSTEGDERR